MTSLPGTHRVTADHGPRPAGEPDRCLYCKVAIGEEHDAKCVLRERLVTATVEISYPIGIPESWTQEDFLFHRNEGTWCADNMTAELDALAGGGHCLCPYITYTGISEQVDEQAVEQWQNAKANGDVAQLRHLLGVALDHMVAGTRDEHLERQLRGVVLAGEE